MIESNYQNDSNLESIKLCCISITLVLSAIIFIYHKYKYKNVFFIGKHVTESHQFQLDDTKVEHAIRMCSFLSTYLTDSTESKTTNSALVTRSSVFIFTLPDFFLTLEQKESSVKTIGKNAVASGFGVASFRFSGSSYHIEVPALFLPEAPLNILSNAILEESFNVQVFHNLNNPGVLLPDGSKIPINLDFKISLINIEPTKRASFMTVLGSKSDEDLLTHQRYMHLNLQKLKDSKLTTRDHLADDCIICSETKGLNFKPTNLRSRVTEDSKFSPSSRES